MKTRHPEYHLVTFDPGGTIGWALSVIDCEAFTYAKAKVLYHLKSWNCGEFSGPEHEQLNEASRMLYRTRYGLPPDQYVREMDAVSEDFDLVQTVGSKKNLLSPVRCNAIIDWELRRQCGLQLNLQARQMRTSVTPERLQLYGFDSPWGRNGKWTTTGKGKDMFAAMQHHITWLKRVKAESRKRPWIIRPGQMPIRGSVT